jgi:hypothetical protein
VHAECHGFRNSASTPCSVIKRRAVVTVVAGSNLSSTEINSTLCPCTPPARFTASKYSFAPSVFSLTPAATDPVKPDG